MDRIEEKERLDGISDWYINRQLKIDLKLIEFRYRTMEPYLIGPRVCELGCGAGTMTKLIVKSPKVGSLTVVDAAEELLKSFPGYDNLIKICAFFEDYKPRNLFDFIILEHIIEHMEDPDALLSLVRTWLKPNTGRVWVGVPNANSLHRLAGVEMGLLANKFELNDRDKEVGHRRVYDIVRLLTALDKAGLHTIDWGGNFVKPISNRQIEETWSDKMIEAYYQLGKTIPGYAAELWALCEDDNDCIK